MVCIGNDPIVIRSLMVHLVQSMGFGIRKAYHRLWSEHIDRCTFTLVFALNGTSNSRNRLQCYFTVMATFVKIK